MRKVPGITTERFMVEIFGIIATALAVFGVVLNNRKLIACFYLWLASNAITAGIHFDAGIFSLLIRDVIFFLLSIEGIYRWRKKVVPIGLIAPRSSSTANVVRQGLIVVS